MEFKSMKAVTTAVAAKKEGVVQKTFGPTELEMGQVWEVWVYVESEAEYYTRYVFDDGQTKLRYFSEFQQFCVFTNGLLDRTKAENNALKSGATEAHANIRHRGITLYVAAFVFVACAISLLVLIFLDRAQGTSSLLLLGGLIASGARMFFGQWVQAGIP